MTARARRTSAETAARFRASYEASRETRALDLQRPAAYRQRQLWAIRARFRRLRQPEPPWVASALAAIAKAP
jgi:hypothetical protein